MLKFYSQLAINNLPDEAITSTFEVIMPTLDIAGDDGSQHQYTPVIEEIVFNPLQNIKCDTRRIRNFFTSAPTDQEKIANVKLTFFCGDNLDAYYYLSTWRDMIYNKKYECYESASSYKKDINVYYYGHDDKLTGHFTLKGCFPVTSVNFPFKYVTEPQRLSLTCDFNVDRIVHDMNVQNSALRNNVNEKQSIAANIPSVISNLFE